MSSWRIKDDVATATVIAMALERFASSPMHQNQIDQFTRYLSEVNWLSTAADLRVAIASEAEWLRVEIPIRLKLAIEQVLGEWDPIISVAVPIAQACVTQDNPLDYSWQCIKCSYVNKYEDSFCEMCFEHYSVSVPQQADTTPSAPELEELSMSIATSDTLPPPAPTDMNTADINAESTTILSTDTFPPSIPKDLNAVDIDAESERFKAMAFAREPDPVKIKSPQQKTTYV